MQIYQITSDISPAHIRVLKICKSFKLEKKQCYLKIYTFDYYYYAGKPFILLSLLINRYKLDGVGPNDTRPSTNKDGAGAGAGAGEGAEVEGE